MGGQLDRPRGAHRCRSPRTQRTAAVHPACWRRRPMQVQNECLERADGGHPVAGARICRAKIKVLHRRKAALSPFCRMLRDT